MARGIGRVGFVFVATVVLVGAIGAAYAVGLLGVPTVGSVDNRFAGVNASTTLIQTDITVTNPNPIGVELGSLTVDYTVRLNAVALANGSKHGVSVESGNSTIPLTTAVVNDRIPRWWVSHLQNDEHTTVRVEANLTSGVFGRSVEVTPVERSVDTDLLSAFNSTEPRPVNAHSGVVSDPVLYINETSAAWGDVSSTTTPIDMGFVVYNPKPVPYTITKISYTITMNDVRVGAGATGRGYTVPPYTERTIDATTAIRNDRLDEWWVTHLRNGQVTDLRIEFSATIELPSGQTLEVPLDRLTYTETIETDFFGNDGGETAGNASESTTTPTSAEGDDTATNSDSGGSATDTATTDRTASPTAVPTPTPDDGFQIGNETVTDVL